MDRIRYVIGLLTLGVAVFVGWLLVDLLRDDDKSGVFWLHIELDDVRGLKPGADVRYRGVTVGSVRDVGLTDDGGRALVTVWIGESAEHLATVDSRFWVVVPRFAGLTGGASGLDTLVRDSYVAFLAPDETGPRLAAGSVIVGSERPWSERQDAALEPVERGDLTMTLLAPDRGDLEVGSAVRVRGMRVGEVRAIDLAEDGKHLRMEVRVERRYRRLVTDGSRLWIARPRVSGALIGGFSVEDIGAILAPYVGLEAAPGTPVPDGYVTAVSAARPEIPEDVPATAFAAERTAAAPAPRETTAREQRIVEVLYEAEDSDTFSANDHIERRSSGVLWVDRSGRVVVATPRSACDAAWFHEDGIGSADIVAETIRVVLEGGQVLRAVRSWVDAEGRDLAVLRVEGAASDERGTDPQRLAFDGDLGERGERQIHVAGDGGADVRGADALPATIEGHRGAVVEVDGRVVGVLGAGPGAADRPVVVALRHVPEELRP